MFTQNSISQFIYSQNSVAAGVELIRDVRLMVKFFAARFTQPSKTEKKNIFSRWYLLFIVLRLLLFYFFKIITCVPGVITGGPRQLGTERGEEVEKRPGQNDDVIHAAVQKNQLSCITNT